MKKNIIYIGIAALLVSMSSFVSSCGGGQKRGELKRIWYNGSYNRDFADLNDAHMALAVRLGITPAATREEAERTKKKMKEIKSCEYYELDELRHSIPYLISPAADLLKDIGKNFQDSLRSFNAPMYKVKVTSVTRTIEDVSKLRKKNGNSSENSAHRYGTTFDVSWAKYIKVDEKDTLDLSNEQLKMVLAMVLRDLKKENRCLVKHERKQGCFHITVAKD
jgi:uncharacterized protein YcbK (DUF882 family)